jgi:parvulin-like peptidyl-prolyl isomerase
VKATIVKAKRHRNIQSIKPKNFWLGTRLTLTLLLGGMLLSAEAIAANPVAQGGTSKAASAFATVGNVVITWQDYRNAYASEASKKFYHAKPAEAELAVFQRQVGDKLVVNALLVQEAMRRKLKPDNAVVDQELQKYEQRFANDPKWPGARPRVLPIVTKRLQDENLRVQLEKLVRNVPPPSTQLLREYYDAHPEKFTSPPQPRVSVILLRVDPSSTEEEWNKAMEEGQGLVKRLRAGEDFAALAREYSGDATAEECGDMGYLHTGMLPGLPEETVSKLQPGETADPVKLLEGVAIFRLTDRIQPPISSFEASRQRISELWLSEQSDLAWNSFIAKLKKKTPVHVNESRFLPLTTAAEKPTEKPAENAGAALPAKK